MQIIENKNGVDIKTWFSGIDVEELAIKQLKNVASMPFVTGTSAMPDSHAGKGATIGSVVATKGAIMPSVVGVDISCGMIAIMTSLTVNDMLTDDIRTAIYNAINLAVPSGRSNNGGEGDIGAWSIIPDAVQNIWDVYLNDRFEKIIKKNPKLKTRHGLNTVNHLGTLGGGNHFIEVCLDLKNNVWVMIHSGSRGIGNRIGTYFINLAKEACQNGSKGQIESINEEVKSYYKSDSFTRLDKKDKKRKSDEIRRVAKEKKKALGISLPDPDLAYFEEGSELFNDYMDGVNWAQDFAMWNRELILDNTLEALSGVVGKSIECTNRTNCHHNYVSVEKHFGEELFITRKGAINAEKGRLGIIPGSMGAKSYIVEGLGNADSYCSASHGAGRKMSRTKAKKTFSTADHEKATEGVICCKTESVIDETPEAYKDIDAVMEAEKDLVKPIFQIKQIICLKGIDE